MRKRASYLVIVAVILAILITAFLFVMDARTVSEREAIRLAKSWIGGEVTDWHAERDGADWIVTATYPLGNRTVVRMDAKTGEQISLTDIEAPGSP